MALDKEKRVHKRAAVKVEITFKTGKQLMTSYMQNVSSGGLFIKTETPLPLNTEIVLNLRLPGSYRLFKTKGLVVWVSPPGGKKLSGIGVQFREMSEEDAAYLKGVVDKLTEKEPE